VHDDSLIALLGSGAVKEVRMLSLDPPFVLGKPVHYVPAHVDVEADVSGVSGFIQGTNAVVLVGHGVTTLGRTVSEAYHRLTTLTAEARRNIEAELLAAAAGTQPAYRSEAEVQAMYRHAEAIIYPTRAERVMHEQ
jgi:rhamnose utilization protein RhaD (predicted bifunctional aldolase and dehydrogenase)